MSLYEYRATMIRVIDGDTAELQIDLGFSIYRREIVRLYGINTPELNSKDPHERERAQHAKLFLMQRLGKFPLIHIKTHKDKTDKYGRMLAEIWLGDGSYINAEMIEEGHAVPYLLN